MTDDVAEASDARKEPRILDYGQLVDALKARRATLSPRLQDVALFFLNHPEDVAILTIVEIAKAARVPPSAITRFTHEMNFDRFTDLQAVFRQRLVGRRVPVSDRLTLMDSNAPAPTAGDLDLDDPFRIVEVLAHAGTDSLASLMQDLGQPGARHDLVAFVTALKAARAIHIVGNRGAFGVACYAFYGFASVGKRVFQIDNFGSMRVQQAQSMAPDEVLLAISFDDYTPETVAVVEAAHAAGRDILAITDNELSPLYRPAKHRLLVKEARLGHFRSQVPAMVLLQSLIVSVGRHRA